MTTYSVRSVRVRPRKELCDSERAAVSGEYALLLAMLSVALVVAIAFLTDALVRTFQAAISILP